MGVIARFLKTSSLYMLGNALTRLIAFLLIPLYTTYLSPDEFGYFNLAGNIATVIVPFFSMEIWTGLIRFLLDTQNEANRERFANAGLCITVISIAAYTALYGAITINYDVPLLGYIYFYCAMQCLQSVSCSFARGFGHNVLFAVSGIVASIVTIGLNIILIASFGIGAKALFISTGIGYLAQAVVIECKVRSLRYILPKYFNRRTLGEMLRFSAPLSLGTVCYWFSTGYSSVAISQAQGLSENGMYAVAGRFVGVLLLLNQVFTLASQEILFKADGSRQKLYNASMNYYFKFLSICTLAMIVLTKTVYPIMVGEAFAGSLRFVPLYFLASFVSYFAIYLGNYFLKEGKTAGNALSLLVPGTVNVVILHLLIGRIGTDAAAVGLLVGYAGSAAMRIVQLRRFTEIRFDYRYLFGFVALSALTFLVFFQLGSVWNLAWALALGTILVWQFRQYIGPTLAEFKTLARRNKEKQA